MARDPQAVRVGQNLRDRLAAFKADLALEITAQLRKACPVDTGHARMNILPSVDQPYAGEVNSDGAYDAQVVAVIGASAAAPIYVTCNAPYWNRLIGGSSQQAPAGFDLAAIDAGVAIVEARHDGLSIDVSSSDAISMRGAGAAAGLAAAYSPFEPFGPGGSNE